MALDDYSALLVTKHLADLEREVTETVQLLEADGTAATAAVLRDAYRVLVAELDRIAVEIAAKAEQYILEAESGSRLRPNPTGTQDPRLEDFLGRSAPLPAVNGSVGINDESVLYDNVSWWWTQEEGYSGHVGRQIVGFFFASGYSDPSAPDPARSREHPLFVPGSAQKAAYSALGFDGGGGGARGGAGRRMTIENPIPARHFVRDGAERAATEWHARVRAARQRFTVAVTKAMGA